MVNSPSTDNLSILKAIVSWQQDSTGDFVDLGEVPQFDVDMTVETLDYFSSRQGVAKKTKSVTTKQAATITMQLDELSGVNMALAMGGTLETDSDGFLSFGVMSDATKTGVIKVLGQNEIGQVLNWIGTVSFTPSGTFKFISEGWANCQAKGEVLADVDGNFGIMQIISQASA